MPIAPITSDQWAIIKSGGYRAREYVVMSANATVFAARINGTPSARVIAQVAYDTVTTGALDEIHVGQTVLISDSSDPRKAFFRGRVRKAPISGTLYINETSVEILDNQYLFVINTYDVAERLRKGAFVDWDVPFHKTGPMIKAMQAAYVVLTTGSSAVFAFNPMGQALAKSATIASYKWYLPNATYTTGSDTTQSIVIEVETPYNDWGYLEVKDSNNITTWFAFTLTAGNPLVDEDIFYPCHDPVNYSADVDNGYTASVSYWAGVETLLDRTRVCVVADERYNAGSAELPNVRFVGYFTEDTAGIRGDERYGQLKDTQIQLAGLLQEASDLTFPSIAVRHRTSPSAWDQIHTPTPVRIAAHVILEHSTLGNLAPIDWGVIDDTYFSGDADVGDTALMDAAGAIAKEINAAFTQDAGGQLVFRRNANFQSEDERDDLPDILPEPLTLDDGFTFSFPHPMKSQVRSVNVGCAVFNATTNSRTFITALAPANGSWGGQEDREIPAQLLAPSSDFQDVLDEGEFRAGCWLTYVNPTETIVLDADDGLGFLSPDNQGWYRFTIAAADHPRGRAITADMRWLLISITPNLRPNGTRTNQATFRLETKPAKAKIDVAVVPSVTETPIPVLPPIPSYGGAWIPDSSVNYDTAIPDFEIPFDPSDMGGVLPLPAEDAETQVGSLPKAGCAKAFNTFRYDQNVAFGFLTTLGAPYLLTIEGSARISGEAVVGVNTNTSGVTGMATGVIVSLGDEITFAASGEYLYNALLNLYSGPEGNDESTVGRVCPDCRALSLIGRIGMGDWFEIGEANTITAEDGGELYLTVNDGNNPINFADNSGTLIVEIMIDALYADAFYQWHEDEDGSPIDVALRTGLLVDNAALAASPPFNPNHIYEGLEFTGTGNALNFKFSDTVYADNEYLPFTLTACGPGAGK